MTARKDIISELPDNVKDKILECLPTRDAARTALLSTHWKHVWLHHGRLVFDTHFLECLRKCEGDKLVGLINVINRILLNRASPVKKFSLCISCPELEGPKPQQSDIDRWCLYLSRNGVEELNITIFGEEYKLPSCIILCRTIKQLKLGGFKFDIDCPQLKTLPDASRDLISKLPVEIKDRILECLTTRDAARTALLSTHWNDVWLQHEQLMFDYDFVQGFQQSQDVEGRTLVSIINNILFSRAGPVKKFTLEIDTENDPLPLPQQSDIDRWTIKKLIVEGPDIDLPLSACGIFSNVTSLAFLNVAFDRNVVVLDPMDIISELPYDVKDKILECLSTRDAVRTALLSTHWKHVWLHHGRLVFDTHFFECLRKCEGDKPVGLVNVINHILLHPVSPVKKFTLAFLVRNWMVLIRSSET
nr:F-box/FBD/LRR-repeat protein At1g13570-like [Ipomoea batatas]